MSRPPLPGNSAPGSTSLLLSPQSDKRGSLVSMCHTGSKGFLSPCALEFRQLALTLGTRLGLGLMFGYAVNWSIHSLGKHLPGCSGGRGWHFPGET